MGWAVGVVSEISECLFVFLYLGEIHAEARLAEALALWVWIT